MNHKPWPLPPSKYTIGSNLGNIYLLSAEVWVNITISSTLHRRSFNLATLLPATSNSSSNTLLEAMTVEFSLSLGKDYMACY
jgi:hypothetical protein